MSEHTEQAALIDWAERLTPRLPELGLLYAIANAGAGGQRGQAGKMKAEGVKRGVPDLCLPVARGGYHGLYIELKATGGTLSAEQKQWIAGLRGGGYCAEVCVGTVAAAEAIERYLGVPAAERTNWMVG